MRKLIYLLPFALMLLGSCLKSTTNENPTPINIPIGTFTGQFRKIHLNKTTGKLDTVKSSMVLKMDTDSGFKVISDTTTIHAGSKGPFQVISGYINFLDSTYPKTGVPAKVHLSGTYTYAYDGSSVFQFYTTSADTLIYQYDLKKN